MLKFFSVPNKPHSLPIKGFSNTGDYCWEDWREDAKKQYPIRYYLSETLPLWFASKIVCSIKTLIYYIKSHTWKKFHYIDIRNYEYKWGYVDADYQILYACFTILTKFVERGKPERQISYIKEYLVKNETLHCSINDYKNKLLAYEEILILYKWWNIERPALLQNINNALKIKDKNYNEYRLLSEQLTKDERNAIKRLADVRNYLWD